MRRHAIVFSVAVPGCTLSVPLRARLCVTCELITSDFFFFVIVFLEEGGQFIFAPYTENYDSTAKALLKKGDYEARYSYRRECEYPCEYLRET